MNWQAEKALLTTSRGPHDNRWDMLPIEIKCMIIQLLKDEETAKARAYWKVCFKCVLGHLIYYTHCQHCGDTKVPTMSHSNYKVNSESMMMICQLLFRNFTRLSSDAFASFTKQYWKGNPSVWNIFFRYRLSLTNAVTSLMRNWVLVAVIP